MDHKPPEYEPALVCRSSPPAVVFAVAFAVAAGADLSREYLAGIKYLADGEYLPHEEY